MWAFVRSVGVPFRPGMLSSSSQRERGITAMGGQFRMMGD
jgi:hypothetical protein